LPRMVSSATRGPGWWPTSRRCPTWAITHATSCSVPAYWRLEFQPAPQLITYTLEGKHYAAASTLAAGQLGELPDPFPVRLDPAELTRRRGPGGH